MEENWAKLKIEKHLPMEICGLTDMHGQELAIIHSLIYEFIESWNGLLAFDGLYPHVVVCSRYAIKMLEPRFEKTIFWNHSGLKIWIYEVLREERTTVP